MAERKLATRTVRDPGGEITYQLERKPVKNLNLRVRRDGSIYVSAHRRVPVSYIDGFVLQKADFLREAVRRMAELEQRRPAPREYADGETVRILGRELTLAVLPGDWDQAAEEGDRLVLRLKDPEDRENRRRLAEGYLDRRCRELFRQALEECWPPFGRYGVPLPRLRVREMTSRWGSCLPGKGIVTLNKRLMDFPPEELRYVTCHELCHFVHPNHSKDFYRLLAVFVPDWRERRAALNGGGREADPE